MTDDDACRHTQGLESATTRRLRLVRIRGCTVRRVVTGLGWLFLVGAAWSCHRTTERHSPPASRSSTGPRWVAGSDGESTRMATSVSAQTETAGGNVAGASNASASPRLAMQELTWTFQHSDFGRLDVVVVLPERAKERRFPMLLALHGRGEAMKGPARGARGWVDDYALTRAMRRLAAPPLTSSDFEGIVNPARLAVINAALAKQPYEGLVVLCPYTPDLLAGDKPFESVQPYARFIVEEVIAKARRELPVIGNAETTGIDGVSLGGRVGFLTGLFQAEHFRSVAGLQAAFDSEDAVTLGRLGDDAYRRNRSIRFRLLTSDRDYFIDANQAIFSEFRSRRLPVDFRLVPGPHDYVFNRGPGSIEMLFFHDRVLRRDPWPE